MVVASKVASVPSGNQTIAHPYADTLPESNTVRCYRFEEVSAKKIRTLGERCRSRDLYDGINLYRRRDLHCTQNRALRGRMSGLWQAFLPLYPKPEALAAQRSQSVCL